MSTNPVRCVHAAACRDVKTCPHRDEHPHREDCALGFCTGAKRPAKCAEKKATPNSPSEVSQ